MDDGLDWSGIGDDGDNEDDEQQYEVSGKDAIILLIDCSKDMFHGPDETNAFKLSLKCAKSVMSNKIMSSPKDLVGIVLFGTEDSDKNAFGFNNITIFQELAQPGAEKIIELDKLINGSISEVEDKFGHSLDFAMSEALWTCSSMFSKSDVKVASKRILLFTNNDDPHAADVQLCTQAQRKAMDLSDVGIYLDLMPIQKPNEKFDMHKFYKTIIQLPEDGSCDQYPDASEKFEDLLERMKSKNHAKRRMNSLMLTLADGLKIGIGVYALVRATATPFASKVYSRTNEELKSMRKTFLSTTGEVLFPSDIKKSVEYSGKTVMFNQDELKEINHIYEPGLVLLGFKPRKYLKTHHFVKASHFIYPSDDEVSGSRSVFAALLTKCIEKKVIGICRYIARANSLPRMVAMIPQDEEIDGNNLQRTPPGFHLLILPFADDLRHLGFNNPVRAIPDQIDKASKLVGKLRFKYHPDGFENPVLQTHWRNVEVLALEKDNFDDDVPDYAKPDNEMIKRKAKSIIDDFKKTVFPDDYEPNSKQPKKATARKTAAQTDYDDTEIRQMATDGKFKQTDRCDTETILLKCENQSNWEEKRRAD
uniref:ATP-dependent DNA helicase 2 subunit 1 n=1 Tax=Strigamia maritima TaxID=126957 RepID=T1J442_STRMM